MWLGMRAFFFIRRRPHDTRGGRWYRAAMPRAPVLLALLSPVFAGLVEARDAEDRAAIERAVAAVRAAAGQPEALAKLAARDQPDPWLVAEALASTGDHDVAIAFAKAAPRPDVARLATYLERLRDAGIGAEDRSLYAELQAHEGNPEQLLEATRSLPEGPVSVARVRIHRTRAAAQHALRRHAEAVDSLRAAADAAAELGWLREAGLRLREAGALAARLSRSADAIDALTASVAMEERRGDLRQTAVVLSDLGGVYASTGAFTKALKLHGRALEIKEKLGDRWAIAVEHNNIGATYHLMVDFAQALPSYQRAIDILEELGDKKNVASLRANIAGVQFQLGDYPEALAAYLRALGELEAGGNEALVAQTLTNIAVVHQHMGDYAEALSAFEKGLVGLDAAGNRAVAAVARTNLGNLYARLGDYERALRILRQVYDEQKSLGNLPWASSALTGIGNTLLSMGETEAALETYKEAHAEAIATAAKEPRGAERRIATALVNIGAVTLRLGNADSALAPLQQGIEKLRALGIQGDVAASLRDLGDAHAALGDTKAARKAYKESARIARAARAVPERVRALAAEARLHLEADAPSRALGLAQQGLDAAEGLFGGLGVEQGASVRATFGALFGTGALAAAREDDPAETMTFLESGRAGALLDALGKREILRWKSESLPAELKDLEQRARSAQRAARAHLDKVYRRGDLKRVRRAHEAHDQATERMRSVVARIQRELKQQAGLFYPRVETIENIQRSLAEDEVLVLYGLCLDTTLAVVLRRSSEHVVELGAVKDVEALCSELDLTNAKEAPPSALAALRKALVAPLALDPSVKTVLVSPEGLLCYLPFGVLFDRPVALTPSGTTHILLRSARAPPASGILALGDPDYAGASSAAREIYWRGRRLGALPATREEAKAVGTVSLLAEGASEEGLRQALVKKARWRSVHFACHGLVNRRDPMLSSLALTRRGEDDGFLTALEVLRMEIPTDLAVLSACETGRDRVVRGEGIVGLTRAFMFAGAPRVLCSLWKVDDEATRALMLAFYDAWAPKDGSKGLPAAAALRKAQAHVRSKPKWEHPYYWAAWVLWGLPR